MCVRPFKNKNKMYCAFNIFYGSMALYFKYFYRVYNAEEIV